MKPFEIFKSGKHITAAGDAIDFSESTVQEIASAYDPNLSEAPLVVGHPRGDLPAYGWVKSISFQDGKLVADAHQVESQFSEMVNEGRFKKRSASFYSPNHPNNPKPGTYYLKHVGFLGAQPPAVKGLKDVAFSDDDANTVVVEFADSSPWIWSRLAENFRGIREWIIEEKGIDAANKIISTYTIDELTTEAERKRNAPEDKPVAIPSFSEDTTMTPEQKKQFDDLTAENARLKADAAKTTDFAEKEKSISEREAALARKEIDARVQTSIEAGRLLPAQKKHTVDFAMSLADVDQVIEFGEGDKAKKVSQREAYLLEIESRGKVVDFGEHSKREKGEEEFDIKKSNDKIVEQVKTGKAKA